MDDFKMWCEPVKSIKQLLVEAIRGSSAKEANAGGGRETSPPNMRGTRLAGS